MCNSKRVMSNRWNLKWRRCHLEFYVSVIKCYLVSSSVNLSIFINSQCYLYTVKIRFKVDNCDVYWRQRSVQENLALVASMERGTGRRDFTCISSCCCHTGSRPTVCPFHCTSCQEHPTSGSGMQANWGRWVHAALTLRSHARFARCSTRREQSVVCDVIILFAPRYFY